MESRKWSLPETVSLGLLLLLKTFTILPILISWHAVSRVNRELCKRSRTFKLEEQYISKNTARFKSSFDPSDRELAISDGKQLTARSLYSLSTRESMKEDSADLPERERNTNTFLPLQQPILLRTRLEANGSDLHLQFAKE